MLDNLYFQNHIGQTVNLMGDGIYCKFSQIREFLYELKNGATLATEKTFELLVVCLNKEIANSMIDIFDADKNYNEFGKLYINDWYIRCKFIGFTPEKEGYSAVKGLCTFYAQICEFTKTKLFLLSPEGGDISENYLDFDFDFDFDLSGSASAKGVIENTQLVDADFVLKFKSPADTVEITIGENVYSVDSDISAGETFTIDTEKAEVYKESQSQKIDLFDKSSDVSFIFEKIPKGTHTVTWNGNFDLSILLLEHRRIPPWI